jgi:single-strand DNA-binding protein
MYQKVVIVGNLGRDPEMRYTSSGQAVTNFPVATNRVYTNSNGERIQETTWFRVSAWGRQAEVCNEYLSVGRQVMVEGRLNADRETGGPRVFTRQDGSTGSNFELTAERVIFLSSRGDDAGFQQGPPTEEGLEDEIPF